MADHLPLLVFPRAKPIEPPTGRGFPQSKPVFPGHGRQVERLNPQLTELQQDFDRIKADVGGTVAGLEPETVLVIEIVGTVDDFKRAIDVSEGLEWIGEWDLEGLEPDEDFYEAPKIGVDFFKEKLAGIDNRKKSKEIRDLLQEQGVIDDKGAILAEGAFQLSLPPHLEQLAADIEKCLGDAKKRNTLSGRLFLSMSNERGIKQVLNLWSKWANSEPLPSGQVKWRDVFGQIRNIRRWGVEESLIETGMIKRWQDLPELQDTSEIHCQVELFYRHDSAKRKQTEEAIAALLETIGGRLLGAFLCMHEIAFHAAKIALPRDMIRRLLSDLESSSHAVEIQLFTFPGVMYFRPTGQGLTAQEEAEGDVSKFPNDSPEQVPVVAILDGVPNLTHDALVGRLLFDDPDNLASEYQPGERRHGTSMASLVVHGDLGSGGTTPLSRRVYQAPIIQPDPVARDFGRQVEYVPDDVFIEDRIERAVRRMFDGEGNVPPQAEGVKIINLSIGDPDRPFVRTPSPCARLIDLLSWRYRVLFCVSAGNYVEDIDLGVSNTDFSALSDEQKIAHVLDQISQQLMQRRLLSPSETLNGLTVGALHKDDSGAYVSGQRTDLLPNENLFSPISRFGYGFRRSIKPELMFPGGRQLYKIPLWGADTAFKVDPDVRSPGQKVAWDSREEGEASKTIHTRGTSNATALATRGGAQIYDVLAELQEEHDFRIADGLVAVLIKALLVHGSRHDESTIGLLTEALKNPSNSRRFKEVAARYIGYGSADIERVLKCTEQRATVLGASEIGEGQIHEYRFPLSIGLSEQKLWRRMVVTLAWFSPINPNHRNVREAKLELNSAEKWDETALELSRKDADHNQVQRGTVQHEILEGDSKMAAFEKDGHILLHVSCKKDATENLDYMIPYGLAVTLEVAEGIDIPIYQQVRHRIRQEVAIDVF